MKYKTVDHFTCAYEVIEEFLYKKLEKVSDETKLALNHFDDFDFFGYTVINGRTVLIDDCGLVISTCTLADFWKQSLAAALEE